MSPPRLKARRGVSFILELPFCLNPPTPTTARNSGQEELVELNILHMHDNVTIDFTSYHSAATRISGQGELFELNILHMHNSVTVIFIS